MILNSPHNLKLLPTNHFIMSNNILEGNQKDLYENMKLKRLYNKSDNQKNCDFSKGECPQCKKGLLNVSLDHSFEIEIQRNILGIQKDFQDFAFDVIECDKCSFIKITQVYQL